MAIVRYTLLIIVIGFAKGESCRQIEFKEELPNRALRNHVIESYQVVDKKMCEIKCYLEPNCVSYNYGPLNEGIFLCELSDKSHLQVISNELESRNGFKYRPIIKNPCLSSPCSNNATCQAGFGDQGYRCVCPRGYHGDRCEESLTKEVSVLSSVSTQVPTPALPTSVVICENSKKQLKCDQGGTISILSANFGRLDRTTCPHRKISTINCRAENSLSWDV